MLRQVLEILQVETILLKVPEIQHAVELAVQELPEIHLEVEAVLGSGYQPPESAYRGSYEDDKELQAIFERTFGPVKRDRVSSYQKSG